jgi:hypothetical protein
MAKSWIAVEVKEDMSCTGPHVEGISEEREEVMLRLDGTLEAVT